MKKLDYGVMILFLLALFVIAFFLKCRFDPIVLIIAIVIAGITGVTTYMQHKKIDELNKTEN